MKIGDKVIIVQDYASGAGSFRDGQKAILKAYLKPDDYRYRNGYRYVVEMENFKETCVTKVKLVDNRKIIGYKCPMDMAGGIWKEGTIFVGKGMHKNIQNEDFYYEKLSENSVYPTGIPKEIVETWEPVYEQSYKVGDWVLIKRTGQVIRGIEYAEKEKVVQISYIGEKYIALDGENKNSVYKAYIGFNDNKILFAADKNTDYILRRATPEEITATQTVTVSIGVNKTYNVYIRKGEIIVDSRDISIQDIRNLYKVFEPHPYGSLPWQACAIGNLQIGCLEVTQADLKKIIDAYDKINN